MGIFDILKSKTDKIASRHLGKKSVGNDIYDASLLVAVPRFENRKQYNIDENNLPFEGFDIWHAYEFSCMTKNGVPVTRVLKLKYSCKSRFIVESKSLKLYLNSFNMTKIGDNVDDCLELCSALIKNDLQECLREPVYLEFMNSNTQIKKIFASFQNIMAEVDEKKLEIVVYKESPELLFTNLLSEKAENYLMFDSLRSNCRVTHQPDFGDVYIYYNSQKHIDEASLVKYLVSFRSEYHFHEECCEMIFKRLSDILDKSDDLFVGALYTRRGGIDITPVRWQGENIRSKPFFKDVEALMDLKKFARGGIKQ